MAYARIRLNFDTMRRAYVTNADPGPIKDWVIEQNKREDDINEENRQRKAQGLPPLPGGGHSTTCCMQASASFNATAQRIPSQGSVDRENTVLNGFPGTYYILTVKEFRAYLTYKYGPSDTVRDVAAAKAEPTGARTPPSIAGRKGVLVFGNAHIELWDGKDVLQKPGSPGQMNHNWMWSQSPIWFWEIGEKEAAKTDDAPDWLVGWWEVYDTNYYYYYFHDDGLANYIKQKPNKKWVPQPNVGNQGNFKFTMKDITLHIVWSRLEPGEDPTEEDFTRVGWSSTSEMNGTSNKYSPLFARKM